MFLKMSGDIVLFSCCLRVVLLSLPRLLGGAYVPSSLGLVTPSCAFSGWCCFLPPPRILFFRRCLPSPSPFGWWCFPPLPLCWSFFPPPSVFGWVLSWVVVRPLLVLGGGAAFSSSSVEVVSSFPSLGRCCLEDSVWVAVLCARC